jgi:sulfur carrier protein
VNDAWHEVASANLQKVLDELGYQNRTFATAVNACFVPQTARVRTDLKDGDRLEIVAPMQGG